MERREFVSSLSIGLSVPIAGCAGDRNSKETTTEAQTATPTETGTPTGSPTPTETPTSTDTPTPTPDSTPDITVSSENLVDDDATYKLSAEYNARAQQSANPDSMTGGHRSSEGEKIVVVRMNVQNTGETNIDLVGPFSLDVESRDENIPFNLPIGDPQVGNILLEPGESEKGWLLASVPEELSKATLVVEQNVYYRANYDSSLQVIFEKDESMEIGMDTL